MDEFWARIFPHIRNRIETLKPNLTADARIQVFGRDYKNAEFSLVGGYWVIISLFSGGTQEIR